MITIEQNCQLFCGDCLEVMKQMPDKSVDVAFTSPPYNRKRNDKYSNYSDAKDDYFGFLVAFSDMLIRITKKWCIVNLQTNYYNRADVYKYIGHFASKIQNIIVWEKTNPMPASGNNITNAVEYFIVLGDSPLKSNTTYTKNHISTSVNSHMLKTHKAVMKQEVSDWFVDKFTKEDEVVLDSFMGLGTTGLSCMKLGRKFIGIELDPEYFKIAENRIKGSLL